MDPWLEPVAFFAFLVALGYLLETLKHLSSILHSSFNDGVPVVGPSFWLFGAVRYWLDAPSMLREGHDKWHGRPFQMPQGSKWVVYITSPKLIYEIATASDDTLSLLEAIRDNLQSKYTGIYIGPDIVTLIRTRILRNLVSYIPDIGDAVGNALRIGIPASDSEEWSLVNASHLAEGISVQTIGRIFVGKDRAQDPVYRHLCQQWVHNIVKQSVLLHSFPGFFRPFISWLFNPLPKLFKDLCDNLTPSICERIECPDNSSLSSRHEDLLSCIVQQHSIPGTSEEITRKVMTVSFAGVHTTSNILTQSLFNLATCPDLCISLRDEVTTCLADGRWSKSKLDKMNLLDSFLKESLRVNPVAGASMFRKVTKPLTLSDGTHLRTGTIVLCSCLPTHLDSSIYYDAETFDGYRFYNNGQAQQSLVVQTLDFFPFGYGPMACPGRLLASSFLKIMLAQIVLDYDLKLEPGCKPQKRWLGIICFPDSSARILFRRRGEERH